jgi:hypothetical protein
VSLAKKLRPARATYADVEAVPPGQVAELIGGVLQRVLEVYRLEGAGWARLAEHRGSAKVRVPPFEAIELELEALWGEAELAPHR